MPEHISCDLIHLMIILKQLFGLLRLLHSENGTKSIAVGAAFGFILGLTPIMSLQGLLIVLILLFLRIQVGAALLSWLIFGFIPLLIPNLLDQIGHAILTSSLFVGLWTAMYQAPIVPLTQFNNTVVMGGFIFGVVFCPIVYYITLFLVKKYRVSLGAYFQNTKFIKVITGSKFYNWYSTYEKNWS